MAKTRTSQVYPREGGGRVRYYGDFRDLGGRLEALIPPGERAATTDHDVAQELAARRVRELREQKRRKIVDGLEGGDASLEWMVAGHLKSREKALTERWVIQMEQHLRVAIGFFGPTVPVDSLRTSDIERYTDHLLGIEAGRKGRTLSKATVRKYLNSLSNMYTRAVSEGHARMNPVAAWADKPTPERSRGGYLEVHEAALLLESARTYLAPVGDGAFPWMYPLLAMYLLTGARKSEILGLEVDDVSFKLDKVFIRPNQWRRLKTATSERAIPLWPQLRELLSEYLMERERSGGLGSLLFPSARGTEEGMIWSVGKALGHISARAGWKAADINLLTLRHTYATQRLQTLDNGAPVSIWTVARELGHKGTAMIEDRYGHLADVRERSPVVEYRVEKYRKELKDRLEAFVHT